MTTPSASSAANSTSSPKTVAVTGATGLIGTALVEFLRKNGHTVKRVVRKNPTGDDILWDPAAGTIEAAKLEGCDAIVHLAGKGIGESKWTEAHKKGVLDSRVRGTTLLAKTIAAMERKPFVFACGSAVGFYGNRNDEQISETSTKGTGFLSDVVAAWEACTADASAAGVRVVHMRTGIVMSTKGGALQQQILPFKLALGGRLGSGKQYLPWISITDQVRAILHVIDTPSLSGPVNISAPNPATNAEFTKALGKAVGRPTIIPIPLFPLKLKFGPQMVQEMLLDGNRVLPTKLLESGFEFTHPKLVDALRIILDTKI
jgi:uncharacterized protein